MIKFNSLDIVSHLVVSSAQEPVVRDLHCRRCIAVSENLVQYVEITLSPNKAATVNMWYRDLEENLW
jgi:hypothetical protein